MIEQKLRIKELLKALCMDLTWFYHSKWEKVCFYAGRTKNIVYHEVLQNAKINKMYLLPSHKCNTFTSAGVDRKSEAAKINWLNRGNSVIIAFVYFWVYYENCFPAIWVIIEVLFNFLHFTLSSKQYPSEY